MKNKFPAGFTLLALLFIGWAALSCSRARESSPVITLGEGVSLPAIKELAWLPAVDGESNSDGNRFVSVTEDGLVRLWDVYSGQVSVLNQNEEADGRADFRTAPGAVTPGASLGGNRAAPLLNRDGTKKIFTTDDGGIVLADAASDKELARYYGLSATEWVCITSEGFYNASFGGASFLDLIAGSPNSRRYNLDQLSGALFRPDLFKAILLSEKTSRDNKVKLPITLKELFSENLAPPQVSISLDKASLLMRELKITIKEQKGGAGFLALYRLSGEEEIPAGLLDIKKAAKREYQENGNTCYEVIVNPEPGLSGVSAFNKNNTIESERLWVGLPVTAKESGEDRREDSREDSGLNRALKVLLATAPEHAEALVEIFSQQEEGDLFSAVEITSLAAERINAENFNKAFSDLSAGANKNDIILICVEGRLGAGPLGNLQIFTGHGKEQFISGEDLLQWILGIPQDSLLLLDSTYDGQYDGSYDEIDTALRRFRQRLGPKAMLAGESIINSVIDGFTLGFSHRTEGSRYTGAINLLNHSAGALAEQGAAYLAFYPARDFPVGDPFINAGELKFQTMTSGMLKIDQVDREPVPVIFGSTVYRRLPPGNYIIDMIYRNGYRETRFVNLKTNESQWVIFTYTPNLLDGSSLGSLPSLGINVAELNPANYEKINREAMEGMGMAPYYVAFLAGEKHYREENFDEAITEYNRALSLKADYPEAFVSRGNARRRKGEYDRAIDDYSRALRINSSDADVYNYRGFAYTQKGDFNRAIADYSQAIRHRADYTDAFFNRAYAYGKQGKWDEAIEDYTQVIKLEPSNSVAYNGRGNAWKNKGDDERAEADYKEAEKL